MRSSTSTTSRLPIFSGCLTATTSSTVARRSRTSTSCSTSTLPNEDWDTVGGFIFGTLEHVPEVGEGVIHEGWQFKVDEVDGRRVRLVRISAAAASASSHDDQPAAEVTAEASNSESS